jgi:hypothetical protein
MERSAYWATAWKLGRYYRTFPEYVEDEVRRALKDPDAQFVRGPITLTRKGTRDDSRAAFVVQDGRYVSARWPGDAYMFAERFLQCLGASRGSQPSGAATAPSIPSAVGRTPQG